MRRNRFCGPARARPLVAAGAALIAAVTAGALLSGDIGRSVPESGLEPRQASQGGFLATTETALFALG